MDEQILLPAEIIARDHNYACLVFHDSNYLSHSIDTNLSDFIPRTYEEAQKCQYSDSWNEAIAAEYYSHFENNTWNIVRQTREMKLLPTKWVFSVKYNELGEEKPKARLVAYGDCNNTPYLESEIYSAV